MNFDESIRNAIQTLHAGGIIAYPTEAVIGLGCNPYNKAAVEKILHLKNRNRYMGLILIASELSQILPLIATTGNNFQDVFATWPGAITWVFPATDKVPEWIRGIHQTVALRISDHPIASRLAQAYANPIVSTSANRHQQNAYRTIEQVQDEFGKQIDYYVEGHVGQLPRPTEIKNAITKEIIRSP